MIILVFFQIKEIDWVSVYLSLKLFSWKVLLVAFTFVIADYCLLFLYDFLTLKSLSYRPRFYQIFPISFVAYALNFSLGSLIGGLAFRFRIYQHLGLSRHSITWLIILIMSINWLGFMIVTSFNFLFFLPPIINIWADPLIFELIALVMIIVVMIIFLAYRYLDSFKSILPFSVPDLNGIYLALQLFISCVHWLMVAVVVYVLALAGLTIEYSEVVAVYNGSSVLSAFSHIPGGLGVMESVFLMAFRGKADSAIILSTLLVFRFLYFWLPLVIALPGYLYLERFTSRQQNISQLGK